MKSHFSTAVETVSEVHGWYSLWAQEDPFLLSNSLPPSFQPAGWGCVLIRRLKLLPIAFHHNLQCSWAVFEVLCFNALLKCAQFPWEEIRSYQFYGLLLHTGKITVSGLLRKKWDNDKLFSKCSPLPGAECLVVGGRGRSLNLEFSNKKITENLSLQKIFKYSLKWHTAQEKNQNEIRE